MLTLADAVVAHVLGIFLAGALSWLLRYNYQLFEEYASTLVWAFLCAEAMRASKTQLVGALERGGWAWRWPQPSARAVAHHAPALFVLVGTLSLLAKVFPAAAVVSAALGVPVAAAAAGSVLGGRLLLAYRRVVSDDTLAAGVIMAAGVSGTFAVALFLGVETVAEASSAYARVMEWLPTSFLAAPEYRDAVEEVLDWGAESARDALASVPWRETPLAPVVVRLGLDDANATHEALREDLAQLTFAEIGDLAAEQWGALNLTATAAVRHGSGFASGLVALLGGGMRVGVAAASALAHVVDAGVHTATFAVAVFFVLRLRTDPLERLVHDLLPLDADTRARVSAELRRAVHGAFSQPLRTSCLFGLVTLAVFHATGTAFPYLATSLAFLLAFMPVLDVALLSAPWVAMHAYHGAYLRAAALGAAHYLAIGRAESALHAEHAVNPVVASLTLTAGYCVHGVQGALLGPLLVALAGVAYNMLRYHSQHQKSSVVGALASTTNGGRLARLVRFTVSSGGERARCAVDGGADEAALREAVAAALRLTPSQIAEMRAASDGAVVRCAAHVGPGEEVSVVSVVAAD